MNDCPYPSCHFKNCDGRHEPPDADMDLWDAELEEALLNEADPIEHAASEYRCAMKWLDDIDAPTHLEGNKLSLVGRIMEAINNKEIE